MRYVLEGSVRKSGHRVRVTAQLIQADTGHHIMAERYDRDLTDLFELQDEIVTTIAGAIEPELLKFERDRIADRPQHNEDAYEFYQHGMWHHYRHNKQDNVEAQAYFRRALAIDAAISAGDGGAVDRAVRRGYLSWTDNAERNYEESSSWRSARSRLIRATRTPTLPWLISMWLGRNDRAAAEFKEAIKLNPSFAAAHAVLGAVLISRVNPRRGLRASKKVFGLAPATRACSSGFPAWQRLTTSSGIIPRRLRSGGGLGRSTAITSPV